MRFILPFLVAMIILSNFTIHGNEGFPSSKIKNIPVIDLEPIEFVSYDQFKTKDLKDQNKYHGMWSTVNKINLGSLKIGIEASSILGQSYAKSNLFDGKIGTAWVEGVPDDGIGQYIKVKLDATLESPTTTPFSVRKIGVIPGYSKSQKTWLENNRVKVALLVIYTAFSSPKENEWLVYRLKFKDSNQLQIFKFPIEKIAANMDPMTSTVWFKIEDIYKGSKFKDTCISEIVLMGACSS